MRGVQAPKHWCIDKIQSQTSANFAVFVNQAFVSRSRQIYSSPFGFDYPGGRSAGKFRLRIAQPFNGVFFQNVGFCDVIFKAYFKKMTE